MHRKELNGLAAWALLVSDAMEAAGVEATDLPERSLAALVLLRNRPGSSLDWLHRRLGITQSGAVRLVDRLEALGLLHREKSPGRKEVALHLTASGNGRLQHGLEARAIAIEGLLESLSAADQQQLAAVIEKALAGGSRRRDEADVACRLCDWDACKPVCPLDASVVEANH